MALSFDRLLFSSIILFRTEGKSLKEISENMLERERGRERVGAAKLRKWSERKRRKIKS